MSDEPWAGSLERQVYLVNHIIRSCDLHDEYIVDVAGAVGTIVINAMCDVSDTREDALQGFKMWCKDMLTVIDQRFPTQ